MNYNKKDILIAICTMLFIISFGVVATVFFKQLYYSDIKYLAIDKTSGLDAASIKENYDALIAYQSIFYQGALHLPDFVMSNEGKIHFQEVKRIFEVIQVIMFISGVVSIPLIYQRLRQKEYRFLKLTGILSIAIPSIVGFVAMMDFDSAFVIFHKIAFRNDFWVFDYTTDPVIKILPQDFFMHCFIMIIVIIVVISSICIVYYNHQQKKILNELS